MRSKLAVFLLLFISLFLGRIAYAETISNNVYAGFSVGYGSTDWEMLVADKSDPGLLILTNPIDADDKGYVWSVFIGYFCNPVFALELTYARFGNTKLVFDKAAADGYGLGPEYTQHDHFTINSRSQNFALVAKFFIPLSFLPEVKPFLSLGPAWTVRDDVLTKTTKLGAQFGGGINYYFNPNWMAIFGFQFDTGSGKSNTTPAKNYIPFLIQVQFGAAYRVHLVS